MTAASFTTPKLAHDLQRRLEQSADDAGIPVIIRYQHGARLHFAKAPGILIKHSYQSLPMIAAQVPAAYVRNLSLDDAVQRIWLDFHVKALLDRGVPAIHADIVWGTGITGKGIKIAILDTGIDPDHPDFGDRILTAQRFAPGKTSAFASLDGNGHGTHVAGIAAGDGTASNGLYRGVAPEATLLIGKVLDDDGGGAASEVIAGLDWAQSQGAQVIGLSLGGDIAGDGTDALSIACDDLVEHGIIVCVAAGNAGPRPYTVGPPGCAKQVLTIGAADTTKMAAGTMSVAGFSSRGPTSDNRIKPDILFPGVSIASCRSSVGCLGQSTPQFSDRYVYASGTSMATPFAVGACALILQAHPEATPNEVRNMLCQTAFSLGSDANSQGSGLANVEQALSYTTDMPPDIKPEPQPRPGCLPALASKLSRKK